MAFTQNPVQKPPFFNSILKNLRFEENGGKQSSNGSTEGGDKDAQLDNQLNELADEKTGGGNADDSNGNSVTGDSDTSNDAASDDSENSSEGNSTDGDSGTSDSQGDSPGLDEGIPGGDDDPGDKSDGKSNRRSEAYNAFNLLAGTLKDSIKRLQHVSSPDADFNDCIAQLQDIEKDMSFFTKRFMNYSAEDAFVQLEVFKKKIELQMMRLKRLNSTKE